ncbi:hypothetical protein RFI_39602 [Reticulomyxa filosa]|uniref:Uncharacterized protein n=1 Tax=Reticulomyxa filosa TaxID=46433 RepID=X6L9C0_RETFI|nr:hypothetical protein RFI_39602 [Reticulomyxa filosa]|eukprot:ETN97925.1 hypothetical protein RFI_39602 [Reticulomyxa filosa]
MKEKEASEMKILRKVCLLNDPNSIEYRQINKQQLHNNLNQIEYHLKLIGFEKGYTSTRGDVVSTRQKLNSKDKVVTTPKTYNSNKEDAPLTVMWRYTSDQTDPCGGEIEFSHFSCSRHCASCVWVYCLKKFNFFFFYVVCKYFALLKDFWFCIEVWFLCGFFANFFFATIFFKKII